MVVIGLCRLRPAVYRLPLDLFISVQFFPQLLFFLCLVYAVAIVALSGHHDLIAVVGGKGMLFIDRVYLFCKFLYIFLEALIPDVVVSVIIALVVHFQPVLEDRSVQDLGRAARQFVDNSASGQLIELLCLFTQIFVIFSDLRIAVNSFRVSQVDGTDLLVDSGDHRASDELRIQGCALHLRNDRKGTVNIVKMGVFRRDHVGLIHLRRGVKDRQEFLFGILFFLVDLVRVLSEKSGAPQIRILLLHQRVQFAVRHIMVIYFIVRDSQIFSIAEFQDQAVVSKHFFHFTDCEAGSIHAVYHSTGNKSIPKFQRLIDIQASHNSGG